MKRIFAFILCTILAFSGLSFVCARAATSGTAYYIDSLGGDDTSRGTSESTAWRTAANLASLTLYAGDKVLFKRGGTYNCAATFSCTGTDSLPIQISAYGAGAMPVLLAEGRTEVLRLFDSSCVTVSDLVITAPDGGGIWIDTLTKPSRKITVENVVFRDMQGYKASISGSKGIGAAPARSCITVKGLYSRSDFEVSELTIKGCEMSNAGNGLCLWGNSTAKVQGCVFRDMDAVAVAVGNGAGIKMTDCSAVNCCKNGGLDNISAGACSWLWGSENCIIESHEIAG